MVEPFTHGSADSDVYRLATLGLLRSYTHMLQFLPEHIRNNIQLQVDIDFMSRSIKYSLILIFVSFQWHQKLFYWELMVFLFFVGFLTNKLCYYVDIFIYIFYACALTILTILRWSNELHGSHLTRNLWQMTPQRNTMHGVI